MTRPATLAELPNREAGTIATLELMRRIVDRYKVSPPLRELAIDVVSDLPGKDYIGEVQAVFNYVADHVRYTRDVAGVETVQTPDVTLEIGAGDCDDQSIVVATLLESIGHRTRFVAVGWTEPNRYSHVYTEVCVNGTWYKVDTTAPRVVNWRSRPPVAKMILEG